ncbi:hypothetical protein HYFRA_00005430 [Hymenoscyphus fraxineus]|uniref:Cytochrome P450 n=1 Tax=Hymenoscyphus fraxineus TaxID=746836 RepID=A0A9N9KT47_9HELO|nr:hypothetical protein HYFRA_00005430 [Hymenoscyphus fraxineus]
MLVERLSLLPGTSHLGAVLLFLVAVLWLRYVLGNKARFVAQCKNHDKGKIVEAPLTFPYIVPLLGSVPISYLWNPRGFVLNPNNFFQSTHPVRVKFLAQYFYVLRGRENVKALFKKSWTCTSIPFSKFALRYAFGLPAKALVLYDKDDSGFGHVPHSGSKVEARNRIDYRIYESLVSFLEGKGRHPFWARFTDNITQQLHKLLEHVGIEWTYHDDLMRVVGNETAVSIINALCGPYLMKLSPNFLQDFWDFDRNLQTYLQGIPWFLAPRAYAVRRRVLRAVQDWQQNARDHFNESDIGADGDDPFWGSSFFRKRQKMFLEMDGFDYTAIASEDFGAIWAMRNAITATSWTLFDIYRDPELLASVRAEVDSCVLKGTKGVQFDIDQLLSLPILQAAYAETLRLRMHIYIIRMTDRAEINIRDWIIPRRKIIVTSTTVAHMDPKAWDTGLNNEHPVDQFWVGRFLKFPLADTEGYGKTLDHTSFPTFSTKDLEGSWIPYGGGPRQCPGRHFAKRQILLTTALMVRLFDCEILEGGKDMKENLTLHGFGGGMSHPAGKVPMRIRRRNTADMAA